MKTIGGPWFEDLGVGDDLSDVPAVTLTEGHTALHQAWFGDRARLYTDYPLAEAVTGRSGLVNPALVFNLGIGQTTIPSQRVLGNLFYRGLVQRAPVFVGDTLRTTTRVVALRQNTIKPGRAASGMVALHLVVRNQADMTILDCWRCPMIPCRDPDADTGHADDFDMPAELDDRDLMAALPNWRLDEFRRAVRGPHFADIATGDAVQIEARDTVTSAPELVRMTLNMAMTHTDAGRSVYDKRLVYGGHTIAMAAAQLSRWLPANLGIVGWRRCDHTAPVFEGDVLETRVSVSRLTACDDGGLVDLNVTVYASRGPEAPPGIEEAKVLDWDLVVRLA